MSRWKKGEAPYYSHEVTRMTGLSYRTLDYWVRVGYVEPSIRDAHGSGSQRLYSERDLDQITAIKALVDAGFALVVAVRMVREGRGIDEARRALEQVAALINDRLVSMA